MLFNRQFELDIQVGEGKAKQYKSSDKEGFGLKCNFDIQKTVAGICETGTVTIYNLPLQDIQDISTRLVTKQGQTPPKNYIQISAGYGDDYGIIYKGGMFGATTSLASPDISIKIDMKGNFYENAVKQFNYSGEMITYLEVAQNIAETLGIPIKATSAEASARIIKSFTFTGSCFTAIDILRTYAPKHINLFISGGTMYVLDIGLGATMSIVKLDEKSGLIGTPEPTMYGAKFTTLLRPSLEAGGAVMVTSIKQPQASGTYRIMKMRHYGGTREPAFFTEIEGQRIV